MRINKSYSTKTKACLIAIIVALAGFIQIWWSSLGQVEIIDFRCNAQVIGYKRYKADVNQEITFLFDINDYGDKYIIMGDGTVFFNITDSSFTYSYDVEGIYNVTLWALGPYGPDHDWLIIEVENDAPDFDIGYSSVEYHTATYDFENNIIQKMYGI